MANTYAANFGDVVKHAVLCELVMAGRPGRYLESHGGRLDYDLATLDPGPGGVWDFLALDPQFVSGSSYGRLVADVAGSPDSPGRYPGSLAFADVLLEPASEIVAFELVESSASNLREGLAERGRTATVIVGDGLSGVCALAAEGDLVVLDPFDVHTRGEQFTAAEAFGQLARRAVSVVLWYAIYEPTETDSWIGSVMNVSDMWGMRIVGDTSIGGLAGCGFLGAHLPAAGTDAATAIIGDIVRELAPVRPGLRLA